MYEASIIKADSFFAIAQNDKCFITMQFKKLPLQGAGGLSSMLLLL